ncbi:hypothetical protein CHUAL_012190 [Chamberlinius hualienensis]
MNFLGIFVCMTTLWMSAVTSVQYQSDSSETYQELNLEDGTTVKSKLVGGEWQNIRCKCHIQNAFNIIQGESFNRSKLAIKRNKYGREIATNLVDGSMIVYFNVDFGSKGAKAIVLKMAMNSSIKDMAPEVKLHIDNPNGELIAKFNTQSTGSSSNFVSHKVLLDTIVTGIHDLYFVINTHDDKKIEAMDLDWFVFTNDIDLSKCPNKPFTRPGDYCSDEVPCHCPGVICICSINRCVVVPS